MFEVEVCLVCLPWFKLLLTALETELGGKFVDL